MSEASDHFCPQISTLPMIEDQPINLPHEIRISDRKMHAPDVLLRVGTFFDTH